MTFQVGDWADEARGEPGGEGGEPGPHQQSPPHRCQVPPHAATSIFPFLNFYAPEAHIMYLTVSSSFLISFVMGGERPKQGD